jgi:DNA-binding NarL/FixJ family response regulator
VISVAIQERSSLLRHGLATLLDAQPDIDVVGVAEDDDDVRRLVISTGLDVLVLEAQVEDWDVIRLVAEARRRLPDITCIGLHHGRRSDFALRGHPNAPSYLLPYGCGAVELLGIIRGEIEPAGEAPAAERRVLPGPDVLTPREREVLRHISAGLTTNQSAALLDVSPKTIDNHKQRMFAKLGVQNQAHAVAVAHRAGILRPSPQAASDG